MVFEESLLTEKAETRTVHTLRETDFRCKDDVITKIDGKQIIVRKVGCIAHSAGNGRGEMVELKLENRGDAERKKTEVRTTIGQSDRVDRFPLPAIRITSSMGRAAAFAACPELV